MADEATATRPWTTMERQIVGPDAGYGPAAEAPPPAPDTTTAPDAGPWTKYAQPQGPWSKYQASAAAEPAAQAKGILGGLKAGAKWVKDAVVGQNEYDYPEVIKGVVNGADIGPRVINNINAKFPDNPNMAARDFLASIHGARGEEGLVDVLKQYDPELEVSNDKFGNKVVKFGESNFYLNKGGLSERDLQEGFRDTLTTLPFAGLAGKITAAAPFAVRALGQAVAGFTGSAASDRISEEAGSQQGFSITDAVAQALGGVGGEALGTLGATIITKIKSNPARYVNPDNTLTPAGADIFKSAGIDPADISDKIAAAFAARVKTTGPTPATAREVAASEFNVPLTRGDATQDFKRQAFEQAAEANARGDWAGEIARGQRTQQIEAIEQAKGNIGEQLGPKVTAQTPQDNAAAVLEGLRTREEAHGKVVSSAYEQAAEQTAGKVVPKKQLKTLSYHVDNALEKDSIFLPAGGSQVYPAATEAKRIVDQVAQGELAQAATSIVKVKPYSYQRGAGPDMGVPDQTGKTVNVGAYEYARKNGAVVLDSLETIRKSIAGKDGLLASAATPTDRRAVRAVVRGYNSWLDDVTDKVLMSDGGDVVAAQIKNARAAASKHFSLFNERQSIAPGATDDAGKVIERMVNAEVTPNEVANFLWGSSKVGEQGRALRVVDRIKEITGGGVPVAARSAAVPPVQSGYVRFYHGGDQPGAGGGRWVTTDPEYARNFRASGGPNNVHYVDVKKGSPEEVGARAWDAFDEQGRTNMVGRYRHVEMPESIAKQMAPFDRPVASTNVDSGSVEWDALRRGMWQKITQEAEGKTQPGPQAVSQNIFEFVNGKGKAMAEKLYTQDERAMMRRFAGVLRDTVPPKKATNPSGSGYEVARAVSDLFGAAPGPIKFFGAAQKAINVPSAMQTGAPTARSASPPFIPALSGPPAVALEQGYMGE